MMQQAIVFSGLIVAVVLAIVLMKIPPSKLPAFFRSKDGLGVAKGIILAPLVLFLFVLVATLILPGAQAQERIRNPFAGGTWFNYAEVYAGADFTKKLSPQCQAGGPDERWTSNLGFAMNIWRDQSKMVSLDGIYHHQSCVIGYDRNSYDALGIRATWRFWER